MLDIRHFGPGYRHNDPPAHCKAMYPALIYYDNAIHVVELHFEPGGEMWEHDADHPILFIVIAGKGRVRVDVQEPQIKAEQALHWPRGKMHKAWAEDVSFTALVVEYEER